MLLQLIVKISNLEIVTKKDLLLTKQRKTANSVQMPILWLYFKSKDQSNLTEHSVIEEFQSKTNKKETNLCHEDQSLAKFKLNSSSVADLVLNWQHQPLWPALFTQPAISDLLDLVHFNVLEDNVSNKNCQNTLKWLYSDFSEHASLVFTSIANKATY